MTMISNQGRISASVEEVRTYRYDRAIARLNRAIALSHGQFSLILVCCNDAGLKEKILQQVTHQFSGRLKNLALDRSLNKLYTTIKNTVANQEPEGLMVFGLESVEQIDQLLASTNLVRGQFRRYFSFPLILWVNDELIKKLVRLAPDFKSWATTIRFAVPEKTGETFVEPIHSSVQDLHSCQLMHSVNR